MSELKDLVNSLTNEEIVSDEIYTEFYSTSDIKPEDLVIDSAEAFKDDEDNKRRFEKMDFNDFLKV